MRMTLKTMAAVAIGAVAIVALYSQPGQASPLAADGKDGGHVALADGKDGGHVALADGKDGGHVALADGKDGGKLTLADNTKDGGH